MDELQRLADVYRLRASSSVKSKLDVLMDLERIRDPRVVPFLLSVLADPNESGEVCIYVVKQLRNGGGLLVPGPAWRGASHGQRLGRRVEQDFRIKDVQIGKIVEQYFLAVQERWSQAWDSGGKGIMLNQSNGFRALMRILAKRTIILLIREIL